MSLLSVFQAKRAKVRESAASKYQGIIRKADKVTEADMDTLMEVARELGKTDEEIARDIELATRAMALKRIIAGLPAIEAEHRAAEAACGQFTAEMDAKIVAMREEAQGLSAKEFALKSRMMSLQAERDNLDNIIATNPELFGFLSEGGAA